MKYYITLIIILIVAGCKNGDNPAISEGKKLQIQSISAEPQTINVNQETKLSCIATHPEGKELTYKWNSPSGTFSGGNIGSQVIWKAPDTSGSYSITVTASDDIDKDEKTLEVLVKGVPKVTTTPITNITVNSANCGGDVTSYGSSSVTSKGVCWSISQNPTVTDNKTIDGIGIGSFNSTISGLLESTTYYVRAYATNSTGTGYGEQVSFTTKSSAFICGEQITYSGKTYNTVLIGTQCWFKENLDVGLQVKWVYLEDNGIIEKYCYDNQPQKCELYGGLYSWDEAMQYTNDEGAQGICPPGWRIPKVIEFEILSNYVNGQSNGLKAVGQGSGTGTGENTSGFSALLGGYYRDGSFIFIQQATYFWSSTESDSTRAFRMYFYGSDPQNYFHYMDKVSALSVRCIKK